MLGIMRTTDRVSATITLDAEPGRVWSALNVDRAEWWPELVFEAFPGETWIEDGVECRATGTVTVVDPPGLLMFEWSEPGWGDALTVSIRLAPLDGGTAVTVIEDALTGISASPTLATAHEAGRRHHLR